MNAHRPDLSLMPTDRRDPLEIIKEQNRTRLQDLVPVRIGRMLESPFAFYRGTAALMASDLSRVPTTGQQVLSCGDAHISNFGLYASPERRLLFDLNDFDEAGFAPWEWDLKRLVTSVYLATINNDGTEDEALEIARETSTSYRDTLNRLAGMSALDRFYAAVDTDFITERLDYKKARKRMEKIEKKARKRNSLTALKKLTFTTENGQVRIQDQPPLMRHTEHATPEQIDSIWGGYLRSSGSEIRYLLNNFRYADHALRVVGVGSVGTRCYIFLLTGPTGEPLFLQVKEAGASVLETYGGIDQSAIMEWAPEGAIGDGYRVVSCQRILQSHSDPFLGWIRGFDGVQGEEVPIDFYWRQFRDMKGSVDLSLLSGRELLITSRVCASLLARAHSQSKRVYEIVDAYGDDKSLDKELAEFARGYSKIAIADAAALQQAADDGDVPVEYGL